MTAIKESAATRNHSVVRSVCVNNPVTKDEFIAAATAAAQASSAISGFPPGITVAQAALESAFGNSELARVANNYFGIKARPGVDGIESPTLEYVDGSPVHVAAKFARYTSMLDCFAARDRVIASLPAYQEARVASGDPEAFAHVLARHWATDPAYAEKLLTVYRVHGLDKLDQPSPAAPATKAQRHADC